jgi:L-lysine 2,3-aminomutase
MMPYADPEKQKEYMRKYAAKYNKANDKRRKLLAKKLQKERRLAFATYKETLQCERCGENHPATLDFHHKGNKDFNVSEMVPRLTHKVLLDEISKCSVLCANCHRKEHWHSTLENRSHTQRWLAELELPPIST